MDPVTMAVASIGISSALGAGGSYLTGKTASKDAKRAQRAMLAFMREASQWGYGYPDWMKQAVQDRYAGTEGRINELRQMYGELKDESVSYTHLRAHETPEHLVCRLLLEKKKHTKHNNKINTTKPPV